RGKECLRGEAEQHPPIEADHKNIVEIGSDGVCQIDEHLILQNFRAWLFSSYQPPHAHKIENSDPKSIPEPVVRNAMTAGAIHHIDVGDVVALASDQRRQEPVEAVEIRQPQE